MSDDSKGASADDAPVTDDDTPTRPPTWMEQHFTAVMGGVLGALLVMIMIVQAAC